MNNRNSAMSVSTDWIIIIIVQITRIHKQRESLSYEIITYTLDPMQDRVHIIQPISKLSVKLNSCRLVGSVYPQGSKTLFHAYGPWRAVLKERYSRISVNRISRGIWRDKNKSNHTLLTSTTR